MIHTFLYSAAMIFIGAVTVFSGEEEMTKDQMLLFLISVILVNIFGELAHDRRK